MEISVVVAAGIAVILIVGALFWSRMVRFRELSEVPVFRVYLASRSGPGRENPKSR